MYSIIINAYSLFRPVAYELQLLISFTFVADQQQKTSVPQTGVNLQEEAKNNGSKNTGATHIRDLFLSFDKGMFITNY